MDEPLTLQKRIGTKPKTTASLPHSQLTDHGPDAVVEKLHHYCFNLEGVVNEHSKISVPGARALVMHDSIACDHRAFMIGREFAHIHPHPDSGSMHVQLPESDAIEVIEKGWGESHYLVTQGQLPFGLVLLFSPRDDDELAQIQSIVARSYAYAMGKIDSSQH